MDSNFEKYIKDSYNSYLGEKPTFTEEMGETIRKELEKMYEQAKEFYKKRGE